jgi:hypothetical protein
MDSWTDWLGSTVYLDEVPATLVSVDDDGIALDAGAESWRSVRPFDVVGLIHAPPLSRWWAAVRERDGRLLRLGRPVRDDVDRRRYPRRHLNLPVSVWWPAVPAEASGLTVDVSVGGFAAVLDRPPPPGTEVAARIEGLPQPMVTVARALEGYGEHQRFAFTDIGEQDTEVLARMTLPRPVRQRVVSSGAAVLWSTAGDQPVTIRTTPLGCIASGVVRCPPRAEHVIVESAGALHRAKVISVGGGVPRLGWLD